MKIKIYFPSRNLKYCLDNGFLFPEKDICEYRVGELREENHGKYPKEGFEVVEAELYIKES